MDISGISKEEIEFLDESNKIERAYIEGESKRVSRDEILGDSFEAWKYALNRRKNFNISYILGVHKKLMARLNPYIAGRWRDCAVYIAGEFCPKIPEVEIERAVRGWLKYCKEDSEGDIEERIRKWHVKFEHIHPFRDGNGRVGRILMNIQRINRGLALLIIHEGKEQFEYYKWFKNK